MCTGPERHGEPEREGLMARLLVPHLKMVFIAITSRCSALRDTGYLRPRGPMPTLSGLG